MTGKSWAMRQGGMSIAHHLSCQDIENTIREQSTWKILKNDWRHLRWLCSQDTVSSDMNSEWLRLSVWLLDSGIPLQRMGLWRFWVFKWILWRCCQVTMEVIPEVLTDLKKNTEKQYDLHHNLKWLQVRFFQVNIYIYINTSHGFYSFLEITMRFWGLPQVKASRQKTGAKMSKSGTLICRSLQAILVILAVKMYENVISTTLAPPVAPMKGTVAQ